MDIFSSLEEVIRVSLSPSTSFGFDAVNRKDAASKYLDNLRKSSDRLNVGLKLFLDNQGEIVGENSDATVLLTYQFFGLSLVRDFLSSTSPVSIESDVIRAIIYVRDSIVQWLMKRNSSFQKTSSSADLPIFNNAVSILALCIKLLYPEHWTSAFNDLLQLGTSVLVRGLKELDIEVVMFQEGRSKNEITHNTLIKDTMRASNAVENVLRYLCEQVVSRVHLEAPDELQLCVGCLECLSELVGWIDVGLFIAVALPSLQTALQALLPGARDLCSSMQGPLQAAVFCCFYELVKKGMDPEKKVQLLHSLGLVQQLSFWCDCYLSDNNRHREEDESFLLPLEKLSMLTELVVLELFNCWCRYEDLLLNSSESSGTAGTALPVDSPAVVSAKPTSALLHLSVPIAIRLLGHRSVTVSAAVAGACNKLISVLRAQQKRLAQVQSYLASHPDLYEHPSSQDQIIPFFVAMDYLNPLLMCIYQQMHYPEDFDFEAAIEFESEIVEAKNEVRKLFVNCCRVYPDRCLELIVAVLCSLPQPLSKAPFPPVDAALRLVYAFSECGGAAVNKMVTTGQFPSIIASIHQTDIVSHPNRQVVLTYFEVSSRYFKSLESGLKSLVVSRLLGCMKHPHLAVRNRSAYFFLKVVEAMDNDSHQLLRDGTAFRDLIDVFSGLAADRLGGVSVLLDPEAEVHLLEALSLLVCSAACDKKPPQPLAIDDEVANRLLALLQELLSVLAAHIHRLCGLLADPQQLRIQMPSVEPASAQRLLAHRIRGVASLARGCSHRSHSRLVEMFAAALQSIASALHPHLSSSSSESESLLRVDEVRAKTVVLTHKSLLAVGPRCLQLTIGPQGLPLLACHLRALLAHSGDSDVGAVAQLLNQALLEWEAAAAELVAGLLPAVLDRFDRATDTLTDNNRASNAALPPLAAQERAEFRRQQMALLQLVASQQCGGVFYCSDLHWRCLDTALQQLVLRSLSPPAADCADAGEALLLLPQLRAALTVVSALCRAWLGTSKPSIDTNNTSITVPQQVQDYFKGFLWGRAIPALLCSLRDARVINARDAASLGVLAEVAALLWTAIDCCPVVAELAEYFSRTASEAGWPALACERLVQQLSTASSVPLGTFKESFKQLMRGLSGV